MIISVLRHAEYDPVTQRLTEHGRDSSVEKARRLINDLGIRDKVGKILVVTSTSPRAIETSGKLLEWLHERSDVDLYACEHLRDDDEQIGDAKLAVDFINWLPDALLVLVVTHASLIIPVSLWLWYTGRIKSSRYLEGPVFEVEDKNNPQ